ncbi:cAMP-binding domain of CRP or a regulatory subunit of cAMP-dependent protein kinases [Chitinophaga eiseniae]|uniref:cAMP-binding domain of CRP or a regulatory subunit of cAMP-dependent protein kinases n=1 Tax=Chitinophaga eiseniae TaxID=634771 RepID=A0A1T4KLQ1_9BACT|nr:Crp/Fnr family transcriptional regulator [Chitinophaga eiseniae]SJZ43308.1 cAMP-binding domain of CRP or a regulatory subunit of cAMP-dependent protein kinases [Chitinophaga eiseniae]
MEHYGYFRQFHDISLADYHLLTDNLQSRSFKKGTAIVVPGQVQRDLYFVKSGVQMAYLEADDKTYVIDFSYAPALCAIAESFSFQAPSKYFLTCLTDTEMACLPHAQLQQLLDQSRSVERLFRRMIERMLADMVDMHINLRAMTIEERYRAFCSKSPELLHLVPHKYIASYLGIDPTNFSKLFNQVRF